MPPRASSDLQIQQQVPLAPFTTFRIGGPARFFCEVATEEALLEAVRFARERGLKIFVLGGGSNLLVSDAGFNGLVLHLAINTPTQTVYAGIMVEYQVAAGTDWDAFVLSVCEQGITGVECLAGIPGLVGGSPIQNIGAYGQEAADTLDSVRALDLESLEFVTLSRDDCGFSYRHSIFNTTHRDRYIVTRVGFSFNSAAKPKLTYADLTKHFAAQMASGETPTPIQINRAVREIRHEKGMLLVDGEQDCRSAGSFFKNPIVPETALVCIATALDLDPVTIPHWPAGEGNIKLPAAWLLERAGFVKGFVFGEAGISSRHTLALINRGRATENDIAGLRNAIQREVSARFSIRLEQEPVQIG